MQHQLSALIGIEFDGDQLPHDLSGLPFSIVSLMDPDRYADQARDASVTTVLRQAQGDLLNLLFSYAIRLGACNEYGQFTPDHFNSGPVLKLLVKILPEKLPDTVDEYLANLKGLPFFVSSVIKSLKSTYGPIRDMLVIKAEKADSFEITDDELTELKEVGSALLGALLLVVTSDVSVLHPTLAGIVARWYASFATDAPALLEPVDPTA